MRSSVVRASTRALPISVALVIAGCSAIPPAADTSPDALQQPVPTAMDHRQAQIIESLESALDHPPQTGQTVWLVDGRGHHIDAETWAHMHGGESFVSPLDALAAEVGRGRAQMVAERWRTEFAQRVDARFAGLLREHLRSRVPPESTAGKSAIEERYVTAAAMRLDALIEWTDAWLHEAPVVPCSNPGLILSQSPRSRLHEFVDATRERGRHLTDERARAALRRLVLPRSEQALRAVDAFPGYGRELALSLLPEPGAFDPSLFAGGDDRR